MYDGWGKKRESGTTGLTYLEKPVVTKVLEPSEDLRNTHTYNEKKVSKSPKRYT
ncbi:unnamed protein product [Ectocarpus sp. CCAP 1310/34]|nr:unnamed protein product [Ectocarpus sp. CCAP 1310/34]